MRRATAFVPGVAAILVASASALTPTAGSAPAPRPARSSVAFTLRSGGFKVDLGNESDGDTAALAISRGGEIAVYQTKVDFTPRSVKARFGRLGLIDLRFRPVPAGNRKGTLGHEGEFEGTIAFTGEHGYIHLDAHRVHGSLETYSPGGSRLPRVASPEDEVTLEAIDRRGRAEGRFIVARGDRTGKRVKTFVYGGEVERREGMTILREAQVAAGPRAFEWDLGAGWARLDPPAPFSGDVVFRRRPHGRARWTGSLRVPILGAPRAIRLTGGGFRAKLVHSPPDRSA